MVLRQVVGQGGLCCRGHTLQQTWGSRGRVRLIEPTIPKITNSVTENALPPARACFDAGDGCCGNNYMPKPQHTPHQPAS
jgi:hypothetical protein